MSANKNTSENKNEDVELIKSSLPRPLQCVLTVLLQNIEQKHAEEIRVKDEKHAEEIRVKDKKYAQEIRMIDRKHARQMRGKNEAMRIKDQKHKQTLDTEVAKRDTEIAKLKFKIFVLENDV
jgi:hypothetical protein